MADDVAGAVIDMAVQIEIGVLDGLARVGLLTDEEVPRPIDGPELRHRTFGFLIEAKARTKPERRKVALTKGALTKLILPEADDEASDELGRKIWEELIRIVWNEVNPNHSSRLQKLVGEVSDADGLGYILVRTKVSLDGNLVDAAYVTTSFALLAEDFTSPLGGSVTRAAKKYAANAAMLIKRGQDPKLIRKGLDNALTNAQALAGSIVDLALPEVDS